MNAIVHGAVNLCWGFFKWGLLVALIAAIAAVPYFYDRLDREICTRLQAVLAEQYAGLGVSIRSAQFIENEGIEIRDLVIVESEAAGPRAELVALPEVFLHSTATLKDLLSGMPEIREVVIRRPILRMTRRYDATWSCSRLLPLPEFGDGQRPLPKIRVEDATVEVFDPTKNPSSMLVLRNLSFTLSEATEASPDPSTSRVAQIEGAFEGDYVSRAEFRGQFDLESQAWSLNGIVEKLAITPESLHAVPQTWLAGCKVPEACRGLATFRYAVSGGGALADGTCRYSISGSLSEGRVVDSRLPGPLTDLKTTFSVDNRGFVLRDLQAQSGQTTLAVRSLQSWGHGPAARKSIDGQVHRLQLDRNLFAVLPDRFRETWNKYLPTGRVNARFQADYDGVRWRPREGTLECLDVSFSYHKFPYRLTHARGLLAQGDESPALKLENDTLHIGVEAFCGKDRVTIRGTMLQPLAEPYGDVVVQANELELHDELFEAMTEGPRKVAESLAPRGKLSVQLRVWSDAPGIEPHKRMIADVLAGSICYRGFPYPLTIHRGQIEMLDDEWTFRGFQASNDTGEVRFGGRFGAVREPRLVPFAPRTGAEEQGRGRVAATGNATAPPAGKELVLKFAGTNIDLEEELRKSLSHPNMQRLWNDLRLRGTVDLEDLTVRYLVEPKELSVAFRAVPHPDTTSIEPVVLPYRLEKLRGVLDYRDGLITVEQFQGSHDETSLAAKLTCRFQPDGSWNLRFDDLWVEQLRLDNELARALPDRVRFAVAQLDVDAPINLRGRIEIGRNAARIDRLLSNWDLNVVFHGASLNCGVPINDVSGGVLLTGGFDGTKIVSRGEVDVDSLTYQDIQITDVKGPILLDDQRVLLGAAVEPVRGRQRRSLQGEVFGGRVYGDGQVALGKEAGFKLYGWLVQADLARAAQELVSGRQTLKGLVDAKVELWGGQSTNDLAGSGNVQLRNADIYELPSMVSLLKILRVQQPDNTAFSESDIDFVIQGDHIYLPKIEFRGDAISLVGAGEMDFEHNLNVVFGTRLGRGDLNLPLIRELLGGAGDHLVVIHVDGPASSPRIVRQPLPTLNRMLEQLQKDLQVPVDSPVLFPQAGGLPPPGRAAPRRR